jgi:hypothetical protein
MIRILPKQTYESKSTFLNLSVDFDFSGTLPFRPCFLCSAHAYYCSAATLLPPMPSLGVSSLDLGRPHHCRAASFVLGLAAGSLATKEQDICA